MFQKAAPKIRGRTAADTSHGLFFQMLTHRLMTHMPGRHDDLCSIPVRKDTVASRSPQRTWRAKRSTSSHPTACDSQHMSVNVTTKDLRRAAKRLRNSQKSNEQTWRQVTKTPSQQGKRLASSRFLAKGTFTVMPRYWTCGTSVDFLHF